MSTETEYARQGEECATGSAFQRTQITMDADRMKIQAVLDEKTAQLVK